MSSAQAGLQANGYPYFPVDCPAKAGAAWTRRLPAQPPKRGEAGRLAFARANGWDALPSNNYRVRKTASGPVAQGWGHGHGIGFCQRGAEELARRGLNFREILAWYFPNARIFSHR